MNERKKLSDILLGSDRDTLAKKWEETEAAKDLEPLPPGEYLFRILAGELFTAKKGTAGYKLTLEVVEGEQEGRRAWHDVWLTPAALPMAKRDLGKIGVTDLEQLERPLPAGILIRAKIVLRKNDDGAEYNRVVRFEPAGIEPGDSFEPAPEDEGKVTTADADGAGEQFPSERIVPNAPALNGIAPGPYDRSERR
jgi:hypothetical protein